MVRKVSSNTELEALAVARWAALVSYVKGMSWCQWWKRVL